MNCVFSDAVAEPLGVSGAWSLSEPSWEALARFPEVRVAAASGRAYSVSCTGGKPELPAPVSAGLLRGPDQWRGGVFIGVPATRLRAGLRS